MREMERSIVHLSIPDFCAKLEELRRPELGRRPLVLAERAPGAVILGVNDLSRKEGVREGMPLSKARRLCRKILSIPPDLPFYREQHERALDSLTRFSPLVEGMSLGRYFVDLTGSRRLFGPQPDTAARLEKMFVEKRGLHARVGLASNKLVSRVAATCVGPGELSCIFPGGEASFLSPLPVTFLPGVGEKTASFLNDFNIRTVGELGAISREDLSEVFGKTAAHLFKAARGIDPSPVHFPQEIPKLCIARALERDEIDREKLEAILFGQVEEAGWMLRARNRYPERLSLEIRYADGASARSEKELPPITTEIDQRLFGVSRQALRQIFQRRVGVRRIALELSQFSMPFRQMSLFPWEEKSLEKDRRLQKALDSVRSRFGRKSILWGRMGEWVNG